MEPLGCKLGLDKGKMVGTSMMRLVISVLIRSNTKALVLSVPMSLYLYLTSISKKAVFCKPRRESLPEYSHAGSLISNSQFPEISEINFY
jgi:hypothetical protein